MTNTQIQKKSDQLVSICNELDDESKRRYGLNGNLFFDAEGSFHLMDGDELSGTLKRQKHVKFSSNGYCKLGGGAW